MRITGGKARSRKLLAPKTKGKENIRPTSDRVREALFSILADRVDGARVLDLYAGTGSFGLDAVSRGAGSVVFVDNTTFALQLIKQNLHNCFTQPNAQVVRLNLAHISSYTALQNQFASEKCFDIIFLDPPYQKKLAETTLTMIGKTGLLAAEGTVIAEERWNVHLPEEIHSLQLHMQRRYGETGIWVYSQTGIQ